MGSVVSDIFGGGGSSDYTPQQAQKYGQVAGDYNPYFQQYGQALTNYAQSDPLSMLRDVLAGNVQSLPGFQYQVNQATGQTQAAAASQGKALSGNELAAINAQSSNLASTNYQTLLKNLVGFQNMENEQLFNTVGNYSTASQGASNWQNAITNVAQTNNQGMYQSASAQTAQQNANVQALSSLFGGSNSILGGIGKTVGGIAGFFG